MAVIPDFRTWFEQTRGVPFPAKVGDPDLYEVVIPRAVDAMADYMDLLRHAALSPPSTQTKNPADQ